MKPKPIPGEPALVLGDHLVVSDLHVGFELELWQQGIKVPMQTDKMAGEILKLANEWGCGTVVLNGDLKHELRVYRGRQAMELEKFMRALREELDVVFIKGNHDGGMEGRESLELGKYLIFHGHSFPDEGQLGKYWITGHVHPHVSFRDDLGKRDSLPVWVLGEAEESVEERYGEKKKTKIMVMPAFNRMRGGFSVNEGEMRGLLGMLDSYRVFLLDGVEIFRHPAVPSKEKEPGA